MALDQLLGFVTGLGRIPSEGSSTNAAGIAEIRHHPPNEAAFVLTWLD
jgi:hypothetical protein